MRGKWWAPAGFAAAALVLAACGSSSSGSGGGTAASSAPSAASSASGAMLKTTTIGGTTVVTDSQGMTLYWFAIDTSSKSNCNGSCLHFWPPLKGPVNAGSGVTGKIGVITRSDGSKQATYAGHPLYTFVGDTAPGQAKGNGKTLSGGKWWEMTPSGAKPAGASSGGGSTPSSSSSGGGYGY